MRKIILLIIILFLCGNFFAENCKYLLKNDADLFLYSNNELKIIMPDIKYKEPAVFSPDGKYISLHRWETPYSEDQKLEIIDIYGNKFGEILLQKGTYDESVYDEEYFIRKVVNIFWKENDFIIVDVDIGPNGGLVELIKLDEEFKYSIIKKISVSSCYDLKISPKKEYIACNASYLSPTPWEKFTNPELKNVPEKKKYWIEIHNTSKKRFENDKIYEDPDPIGIPFDDHPFKDYHFSDDGNYLYIEMEGGKFYKYSIEEKQLKEIKQLPKELKIKKVPETIKIKKGKKEIELDVLDMHCEE